MAEDVSQRWVEKVAGLSPWEEEALKALAWPLREHTRESLADYALVKEGAQWVLWPTKFSPFKPFEVSFTEPGYLRSLRSFGSSNPLAKAMGRSAGPGNTLLDATAGWLGDALFLAKWGLEVTALERSPAVYLLVRSALEAALKDSEFQDLIGGRVQYRLGDASQLKSEWDFVYYDPMYAPKKALADKSMQILKDLVGADEDRTAVFEALRSKAKTRLVMKRPPQGKPISEPSYSLESKTVGFDIFLSSKEGQS